MVLGVVWSEVMWEETSHLGGYTCLQSPIRYPLHFHVGRGTASVPKSASMPVNPRVVRLLRLHAAVRTAYQRAR